MMMLGPGIGPVACRMMIIVMIGVSIAIMPGIIIVVMIEIGQDFTEQPMIMIAGSKRGMLQLIHPLRRHRARMGDKQRQTQGGQPAVQQRRDRSKHR